MVAAVTGLPPGESEQISAFLKPGVSCRVEGRLCAKRTREPSALHCCADSLQARATQSARCDGRTWPWTCQPRRLLSHRCPHMSSDVAGSGTQLPKTSPVGLCRTHSSAPRVQQQRQLARPRGAGPRTCQWNRSSPAGPALHDVGGSFCKSCRWATPNAGQEQGARRTDRGSVCCVCGCGERPDPLGRERGREERSRALPRPSAPRRSRSRLPILTHLQLFLNALGRHGPTAGERTLRVLSSRLLPVRWPSRWGEGLFKMGARVLLSCRRAAGVRVPLCAQGQLCGALQLCDAVCRGSARRSCYCGSVAPQGQRGREGSSEGAGLVQGGAAALNAQYHRARPRAAAGGAVPCTGSGIVLLAPGHAFAMPPAATTAPCTVLSCPAWRPHDARCVVVNVDPSATSTTTFSSQMPHCTTLQHVPWQSSTQAVRAWRSAMPCGLIQEAVAARPRQPKRGVCRTTDDNKAVSHGGGAGAVWLVRDEWMSGERG